MSSTIYLILPLAVLLVILQSAVLPHFPLFGAVPQLFLLVTLAWGLLHGLQKGILWAFVVGIFIDLFSAGPMGLTSLALMAAVAVALLIQRSFPGSRIIMPVLLALVATLVFWFVYLLLLRILMPPIIGASPSLGVANLAAGTRVPGLLRTIAQNYGLTGPNLRMALLTALVHSLLILPIYWAFHSLERIFRPRRVEI